MKEKILELRALGWSYRKIEKELNCSKATISFHCGNGQKLKNANRRVKYRTLNFLNRRLEIFRCKKFYNKKTCEFIYTPEKILKHRIYSFSKESRKGKYMIPKFTKEDFLNKIGPNPICYLTGESIDLNNTESYNLDHIIPRSKGGNNSLENCGLASKIANHAKCDLHVNDFIELCKKVLLHNGYKVRLEEVESPT